MQVKEIMYTEEFARPAFVFFFLSPLFIHLYLGCKFTGLWGVCVCERLGRPERSQARQARPHLVC